MTKGKLKDLLKNIPDHCIHEVLRYGQSKGKILVRVDDALPSVNLDLVGFWAPEWNMNGLKLWIQAIKQWITNSWEYGAGEVRWNSWRSIVAMTKYIWSIKPFKTPWSGWVWVMGSLEQEAEIFLENKAWDIVEKKQNKQKLSRRDPNVLKKYGELKNKEKENYRNSFNFKNEEFLAWLKEVRKLEPCGNVFVSLNDPTVFFIDHRLCPFNEERGWSEEGVKAGIGLWLKELDFNFPVEIEKDP